MLEIEPPVYSLCYMLIYFYVKQKHVLTNLGVRVQRPRQTLTGLAFSLPNPGVWCQDKCYATIPHCMNSGFAFFIQEAQV